MTYKEAISIVSEELGLPKGLVDKVYKSYWTFVRNTIKELPLKREEELTEEEFSKLPTSFNIPSMGKLVAFWDSYKKRKYYYNKYIKPFIEKNDKVEEDSACVYQDTSDS